MSKLRKEISKVQDEKRYEHTLGVAYTAANLAACHGGDIEKALIAGLLHDCAKGLSEHKLLDLCEKHHLQLSREERKKPSLLHAKVGSYLAHKKYKVTDPDILNAICYHTTGRPEMSLLEKIVFVADYMEPGRRQAPRLEQIRRASYADLNQAVLMILEDTLAYLKECSAVVDQTTQATYEYYLNIR
ncbi:MAG: bis(5'-nucleosyl)-tetraphosphatase (symmetrical) YqeK [bacterium]|nr:bis(5'-nucleosyl)-tetraphosphatase (symmetrical) YqeK [bacterium]MCM1375776.1 bis(5'-nucleosyl)-tetraphosphatase (symmetrical) YqeK [Muribaculum sp.]